MFSIIRVRWLVNFPEKSAPATSNVPEQSGEFGFDLGKGA
jgi:hypothetical protein